MPGREDLRSIDVDKQCFFNCLKPEVSWEPEEWRREIAIELLKQEYNNAYDDSNAKERYIVKLLQGKGWADDSAIQAAAHLCRRPILVYSDAYRIPKVFCPRDRDTSLSMLYVEFKDMEIAHLFKKLVKKATMFAVLICMLHYPICQHIRVITRWTTRLRLPKTVSRQPDSYKLTLRHILKLTKLPNPWMHLQQEV